MNRRFFSRNSRTLFLSVFACALVAVPVLVRAVVLPYTAANGLSVGGLISSSLINQNFNALNTSKFDRASRRIVNAAFTPPAFNSFSEGSVTCPAGTLVVGGGCFCNSFGPIITVQNSPNPFVAESWFCRFANNTLGDVSNVQTLAYAICLGTGP